MKILCIHGSGTSADIFKNQTSNFRSRLGPEYVFDFVNAPYPWIAGAGVGPFFEGPYYTWWLKQDPESVKATCQDILKRLETANPPYDAMLGFSQGCQVISSLILAHQHEHPGKPLPIKGAAFICGGVPLWILEQYMPVSAKGKAISLESGRLLDDIRAQTQNKINAMLETGARVQLWDQPTQTWNGKEVKAPSWTMPNFDARDVYGLDLSQVPETVRCTIPTLHVYGHKDPVTVGCLTWTMLCEPEKRLVYDHAGGHEIPRLGTVSEELAKGMKWLNKQIQEGA